MDSSGTEEYRIEGFLPVEDFLAELEMGLAKISFDQKQYAAAETKYRSICDIHPRAGVAPEACYWAGVSAYKATNDPAPLKKTAELLVARYKDSEWTRKASVWSG